MKRAVYVIKRFLSMILILAICSMLIFFLLRLSKVDPLAVMIGKSRSSDELKAALTERYDLDKPLFTQYCIWISGVIKGDFGIDYIDGQNVRELISSRLPVTVGLVVLSSVIGFAISILMGVCAALKRGKAADSVISSIMLIVSGTPSFLISILVLIFMTIYVPSYSFIGTYSNVGEFFGRIIIPSIIMSLTLIAMLGRITRSSMIKQLQSSYIDTAKAKGLGESTVTFKHAFHNAVIPVITAGGYMIAGSIGSTVIVEQIFSLPGIGGLLISAIQTNNYPIVQILVLFMLAVYLIMNFIIDILYIIVDPRVDLE
ncbi:MAG: ABC transporter permease [Oscillospiraceae bacterium]|nr:ABC transporter permease [Oscillospiraceae bacterium]MDY6208083.1 ABC transporter permease [Oscillospiraceae bacterium]